MPRKTKQAEIDRLKLEVEHLEEKNASLMNALADAEERGDRVKKAVEMLREIQPKFAEKVEAVLIAFDVIWYKEPDPEEHESLDGEFVLNWTSADNSTPQNNTSAYVVRRPRHD